MTTRRSGGRGRGPRRFGTQRRKRIWGLHTETQSPTAGNGVLIDLLGDFKTEAGLLSTPGYTVARILLHDSYQAGVVGAYESFMGIFVGTGDDTPANSPAPDFDNADWMWTWRLRNDQLAHETSAGVFTFDRQERFWDIRVMRKIEEVDQVLYLVIRNNTQTVTHIIYSRTLVLLP